MPVTAKLTKILFVFLFANAAIIITVAALRPVFGSYTTQPPVRDSSSTTDTELSPPRVDDPPPQSNLQLGDVPALSQGTLPGAALTIPPGASTQIPPSLAETSTTPPNAMVLDEMRKLIQEGRGQLDVPPLSFPALDLKTGTSATGGELEELALRMRSIGTLTQAAQSLIKEAQHLQSKGNTAAAADLVGHARVMKSVIGELSGGKPAANTPLNITR